MDIPTDAESIRGVLEQGAGAAFHYARVRMEDMNLQDAENVRRLLEYAATEAIARAQEFEIPARAAFHGPAEAVEETIIGLWPILKKITILWTVGFSVLLSSIGLYGLFYFALQPGKAASEPLFFDYSGIAKHPAPLDVRSDANETSRINDICTQNYITEELQGAAWAAVDFFSKHTQWEAHHHDVTPKPLTETKILKGGSAYYFEIILELPESQINRRTGMFTVHVELQSTNGTKLASSVRAARIPHESEWISIVRKSLWIIPLIIEVAQETRTVVIPSFRHFKESPYAPLRYATVSLVMPAKGKWRKDDPLEVIGGEIRVGIELTDFQFLLREWFFTCYTIGVAVLSAIHVAGILVLRAVWKHQQNERLLRQMREEQEDLSDRLDLDESQLEPDTTEWENMSQSNDAAESDDERTQPPMPPIPNGTLAQEPALPNPDFFDVHEPFFFEQEMFDAQEHDSED